MPGALQSRIGGRSPGAWRTATWAAPLVVQAVFAAAVGIGWPLVHFLVNSDTGFAVVIAATAAVTAVASLMLGARLLSARSSHRQGLGFALGGAALAVAAVSSSFILAFLTVLRPG